MTTQVSKEDLYGFPSFCDFKSYEDCSDIKLQDCSHCRWQSESVNFLFTNFVEWVFTKHSLCIYNLIISWISFYFQFICCVFFDHLWFDNWSCYHLWKFINSFHNSKKLFKRHFKSWCHTGILSYSGYSIRYLIKSFVFYTVDIKTGTSFLKAFL